MRRKIILILTLLLLSVYDVFGKNGIKTKQLKPINKNKNNKVNVVNARIKRSLDDGTEKILLLGKGNVIEDSNQYDYLDGRARNLKLKSLVEEESPFWGNRGRRESLSGEINTNVQLPIAKQKQNKNLHKLLLNLDSKIKDEILPFWSNRGRRYSDDSKEDPPEDLFWGTRGRRQDDNPFWGTRGRREGLAIPLWNSKESSDDEEPFWGNRGRRQEQEPFWGNRGRREQFKPFLDNGKNKAKSLSLYKNVINQNTDLNNAIVDAINDLRNKEFNDINKRDKIHVPILMNDRNIKIKSLVSGEGRNRKQYLPNISNKFSTNELHSKTFQQNTVHDDRMFADEPHYILVERSGRSSAEDDPFFISRGKKYSSSDFAKAARDRRGALEEIVKTVRNDPYYIARGKKDYIKIGESNTTQSQFHITKDLICATVDLLMMRHSDENKVKREVIDKDRDRRTTLKKLAMQLQMDPYFVSRGKRDGENNINSDDLEQFINKVIVLCN